MTRRRVLFGVAIVLVVAGVGVGTWLWLTAEQPPERSPSALCAQLSETVGLDSAIVTLDPTRLGPLVTALDRSVEVAPAEIVGPLTALTDFVREVTDEVRSEPTDKRAALIAAIAARQDRVDEVGAAGRTVEDWNATNCGTTLRSTTSTTPRSTTTIRR